MSFYYQRESKGRSGGLKVQLKVEGDKWRVQQRRREQKKMTSFSKSSLAKTMGNFFWEKNNLL